MNDLKEEAMAGADMREGNASALRKLAVIALMSVVLGLTVQLAILALKVMSGGVWPGVSVVADAAQGVTWALLVCTGVGIGTSIMRARAHIVGLLGALVAPAAVAAAKGMQSLVASALDLAVQDAVMSLGAVSLVRAFEYGLLGYLLGSLARRGEARLSLYLAAGAAVGVVLGGAVIGLNAWLAAGAAMTYGAPQVATGIVNEMLFPIGCALVIYGGQMVGKAFSRAELVLT
jgi:hypothetical protein